MIYESVLQDLLMALIGGKFPFFYINRDKMVTESGHVLVKIKGDELARLEKNFKGSYNGKYNGLVRVTPGDWLYPGAFKYYTSKLYNFKWKSTDVLVAGFLKCGTTWLQEIVWTMRNNPNLDNEDANSPILSRVPIIDLDMYIDPKAYLFLVPGNPLKKIVKEFRKKVPHGKPAKGVYLQTGDALPDPRTLKSHFPFSMLNPSLLENSKVVYIARNPRDMIISLHHMYRLFEFASYTGTLEQFVDHFTNDEVVHGPFWRHVKEAWQMRHHPNLHFVFYEDLRSNTKFELKRINDFLGTNLTPQQLENVEHYTSFEEMKKRDNFTNTDRADNPNVNQKVAKTDGGFFRKGQVGNWKEKLTPQMIEKIDQYTKKHLSEIPFRYSAPSTKLDS